MHAACVCLRVCVLIVVFICTLIFLISRLHTFILVACTCVWEGGGAVMWLCKQETEVRVCTCLFLMCLN